MSLPSNHKIALCVALSAVLFLSCTPSTLREAQEVVTQADSLWHEGKMYGIDEGDSAALAQAYQTLSAYNSPLLSTLNPQLSTICAHACYHYGRLLREKDDPVAAMECFIRATHSHTHDYHILGRVYSNISGICRQAEAYDISYDAMQASAQNFMYAEDSVSYYYALNAEALILTANNNKSGADSILSIIESNCNNPSVLIKTKETRAEAFLCNQDYDSAIIYATDFYAKTRQVSGLMIKAQAFSFKGEKDSALTYARLVMDNSDYCGDKYNALYILSHDDTTLCTDDILRLTSDREDERLQNYEPWKEQLMIAVTLLEQDQARKPNLAWSYAVIATIIVVGGGIGLYVVHKHKRHGLLTQQLKDMEAKKAEASMQHKILVAQHASYENDLIDHINQECSVFRNSDDLQRDLCWNDYHAMCEICNSHFHMLASKLQQTHRLNETEIRLCILVLIGLNRTDISTTLPYALNSVGKLKDQTAKKLGTTGKNLRDYLLKLSVLG